MASLEPTTRLLKEKTNQMEIDRIKRQELEEALLHSQKMKAVGQLTGGSIWLVFSFSSRVVCSSDAILRAKTLKARASSPSSSRRCRAGTETFGSP